VANDRYWSGTSVIDVLFSFFIWLPSWNNSISCSANSSPIICHRLLIRAGAANMTNDHPPYNAALELVLLTTPTNTLVLQTQRKSGKCDYWCCLFAFP
jgi:hypothetical protein